MRQVSIGEVVDFPLTSRVSIRVYADCRPHALQTTKLQKGCVLVLNGRELSEEGLGFGFPVCLYEDGAHFSSSAVTLVDDSKDTPRVTKIYEMDAVESKKFRGAIIRRGCVSERLLRILERTYRDVRRLHVGAAGSLSLLSMLGLRNEYVKSRSKGQIIVTYERQEEALRISVGFKDLVRERLEGLVVGNEQGGMLFTEYSDPIVRLEGKEIEPWKVTSADWATLSCPECSVGFKLRRPNGWRIIRGREVVKNRISWSGLNLQCDEIQTSNALSYIVEFVRGA